MQVKAISINKCNFVYFRDFLTFSGFTITCRLKKIKPPLPREGKLRERRWKCKELLNLLKTEMERPEIEVVAILLVLAKVRNQGCQVVQIFRPFAQFNRHTDPLVTSLYR